MNINRFVHNGDISCTFCKGCLESIFHLLFDCPMSKMVFDSASLSFNIGGTLENVNDILMDWMEHDTRFSFTRRACILWNIWKMRNDMVFQGVNFSVILILKKVSHDVGLCMVNYLDEIDREGINPQQQQWIPPDDNYVKINTDAALIRNKGTTGAVAQDHRGVFLGRETITFDATSSIMDEAIVCRLGITLAKILSVDNVIFEGDAKNVTTAILGDSRDIPWNICSVIPEIKHEASSFDDAKF